MTLTSHQRKIVEYARQNDNKITKKEACSLIPFYHNSAKHVGDILSRMVKSGIMIRIKPGQFQLSNGQKAAKSQLTIENQHNLL